MNKKAKIVYQHLLISLRKGKFKINKNVDRKSRVSIHNLEIEPLRNSPRKTSDDRSEVGYLLISILLSALSIMFLTNWCSIEDTVFIETWSVDYLTLWLRSGSFGFGILLVVLQSIRILNK